MHEFKTVVLYRCMRNKLHEMLSVCWFWLTETRHLYSGEKVSEMNSVNLFTVWQCGNWEENGKMSIMQFAILLYRTFLVAGSVFLFLKKPDCQSCSSCSSLTVNHFLWMCDWLCSWAKNCSVTTTGCDEQWPNFGESN